MYVIFVFVTENARDVNWTEGNTVRNFPIVAGFKILTLSRIVPFYLRIGIKLRLK